MWELKVCTVCFESNRKLLKMDNEPLRRQFQLVSGLQNSERVGMPQYLCFECAAFVTKFIKFRDKCHKAHFTLSEILKRSKEIKLFHLQSLDRDCIGNKPSLSYLDFCRSHFITEKFQWVKHNRLSQSIDDEIPVMQYTTSTLENNFEIPNQGRNILKNLLVNDPEDEYLVKTENDAEIPLEIEFDHISAGASGNNTVYEDPTQEVSNSFFDDDDNFENDNSVPAESINVDGSNLDQEYATLLPISEKEAKVVLAIQRKHQINYSYYKFRCEVCDKQFTTNDRLTAHSRMHDMHISGNYCCKICNCYYKTDFKLKKHMTDKHMYKYLCKKCPEVSFERFVAKQHYMWTHLNKKNAARLKNALTADRPEWLTLRGPLRTKQLQGEKEFHHVRKMSKLPKDFLKYTPVSQEEQYQTVQERKTTRNYLEGPYKCELCFRGFREAFTFEKHMKKHNPEASGSFQCDMCKQYFVNTRKLYKHMNITHLFKYACQSCTYICYNKGQAHMHYRWHNNVTYKCTYCEREFLKASTRLTHMRIKHPSSFLCNLCGHSFVSQAGLYCHKRLSHTTQEIEMSESMREADATGTSVAPQGPPGGPEIPDGPEGGPEGAAGGSLHCAECAVTFASSAAYYTHLGTSFRHATTNAVAPRARARAAAGAGSGGPRSRRGAPKPRGRRRAGEPSNIVNTGLPTATNCEVCNKYLSNDVQARKHYEAEHPGHEMIKRYMCDVCGHTTRQYANLLVHMRTHTNEKPYGCPHCERRFSMPSNRDRHLVVHTGEKRFECQHCGRRFTQSSAVKLHIQTVHLKIPYAPWDKKNRKRRKELEGAALPTPVPAPPKVLVDTQGDYLNAYITYNE